MTTLHPRYYTLQVIYYFAPGPLREKDKQSQLTRKEEPHVAGAQTDKNDYVIGIMNVIRAALEFDVRSCKLSFVTDGKREGVKSSQHF